MTTKKKSVKAWAIVESDGTFRKAFTDKRTSELNVSSYAGERIVKCTITYSI